MRCILRGAQCWLPPGPVLRACFFPFLNLALSLSLSTISTGTRRIGGRDEKALGGGDTGWNRNFEETCVCLDTKETGCSCCLHGNEEFNLALATSRSFLPDFAPWDPGTLFSLFYCFIFAPAVLANYYLAPFAFFCFFFFVRFVEPLKMQWMGGGRVLEW